MSLICISDVHLGYQHSRREEFARFLGELAEKKEVEGLVVVGDLLDMWRRDMAGVVLENADILGQMARLSFPVYYVAGNHDYHVRLLRNFHYPFFFSSQLNLTQAGVTCRFLHGYEFDPTLLQGYFEALCYTSDELGEMGSQAYSLFTRLWQRWPPWPGAKRRRQEMKQMLRPPQERIAGLVQGIEERARAQVGPGEVLVFGHTHRPFAQGNLANCGSWVADSFPSSTYIEITSGQPNLHTFPP